jgi:hypothetical protein
MPADVCIAAGISKAIMAASHAFGIPVTVLHAVMDPRALASCCAEGCSEKSAFASFLCPLHHMHATMAGVDTGTIIRRCYLPRVKNDFITASTMWHAQAETRE